MTNLCPSSKHPIDQDERVLYVSYDGMLEPLGQSQVLAYLKQLSASRTMHLISYEKRADWADAVRRQGTQRELAACGVHWHPLRYHKSPSTLATAWDIMIGTGLGLFLVMRHRLFIVHARSYVAAVIALVLKLVTGARFIFDMRGLWADERVDGGLWRREARIFRVAKWFERQFLSHADHVVSLTHAGEQELRRFPYLARRSPAITVIPTCADLDRFRPLPSIPREFALGYVGSAGTWYDFDAAVACFAAMRAADPTARFLIVNRGEHDYIRDRLAAAGLPLSCVELRSASHEDMPSQMSRIRAGVFFVKPVYSKQASAPTKLGELLGCGIPCLSNQGVGDMARILEEDRVGVAVASFERSAIDEGLQRLLRLLQERDIGLRCRDAAQRRFALEEGVARYAAVYRSVSASLHQNRRIHERQP
ncbi:glycosyltransferase family 4 protein [Ramlibacter monticola]|uniref:Glycosyltransferase n=1 Tax=Ramlibacter monticola TaxID=1926872 RepID=A0A937CW87_9BURK|nr:glycosyltransferase [Ramlibacter monticola]MBL0395026.1 glycosyltransferase [Ramlibacter monticola]